MAGGETPTYTDLPEQVSQEAAEQELSGDLLTEGEQELIRRAREDLQNPVALELAENQHNELIAMRQALSESHSDVVTEREEFLSEIELLDYIEETFSLIDIPGGDTEAGLSNMFGYLNTLPDEQRLELADLIANPDYQYDLEDYFMENGFVNSETLASFQVFIEQDLGYQLASHQDTEEEREEVAEEREEVAEEREEVAEEREEVAEEREENMVTEFQQREAEAMEEKEREFLRSKQLANDIHNNTGTDEGLLQVTQFLIDAESAEDVLESDRRTLVNYFTNLAQSPEEFTQVMDSLGGQESQLYQRVQSFVLAEAPGLQFAFERYEGEYVSPLPITSSEVAREVTEEMNAIPNGTDIEENIDYSQVPPTRSISLDGSEYQLDANLPVADFYPATVEYTEVSQEIIPQLDTINAVLEYIDGLTNDANLTEVKQAIAQMMPYTLRQQLGLMDLDTYTSIASLKEGLSGILGQKRRELEEKLEEVRREYEASLARQREAYKRTIRERQERQRDILVFLHASGFDLIPQSFTDRIIEQINITKNIDLGNGMFINQNIDIANGQFGFDALGDGTREKEGFIRLINKLITGQSDGPDAFISDPASFVSQNRVIQDTKFIHTLNNGPTAIISGSGGLNMNQVRMNLGWNS